MEIGIVAEGSSDVAVLRNILKGKLGLDAYQVPAIRPELSQDETDLARTRPGKYVQPGERSFSNWLEVINECRNRVHIETFLHSPAAGDRFVVVQLDTDMAHQQQYEVTRPPRDLPGYVEQLRSAVVEMLAGHLGETLSKQVCFAVTIEEMEAWVLPLYDSDSPDAARHRNPKKVLEEVLRRKTKLPPYTLESGADVLTQKFRKPKLLIAAAKSSRSLELFLTSLEALTQGAE